MPDGASEGTPAVQKLLSAPSFTVSERDHELAEQWWEDQYEQGPETNEEKSALWILASLLAQARAEGPRDPSPTYQPKWR